jgi:type 1 fimbria pilin
MKTAIALLACVMALAAPAASADSSCTAHSSDEGTPRTCSVTCRSGKQAICEEGVAGREPQCRCAEKSRDTGKNQEGADQDSKDGR